MIVSDSRSTKGPLLVVTHHGDLMDLGPLVHSACDLRRNALRTEEFGDETNIDGRTLAGMLLGMQTAVRVLGGDMAADLFHAHLSTPGSSR